MRTLILFAILCLLLQGCVGVGVMKTRTKVIDDPEISLNSSYSSALSPDDVSKRTSRGGTNAVIYTAAQLQEFWGHPNHITLVSGSSDELWTYKSRTIWEGVIPVMIIPIPLVLPVTREKVRFTIRDGRVINARITRSAMAGGAYGMILGPDGRGGWGATSLNNDSAN